MVIANELKFSRLVCINNCTLIKNFGFIAQQSTVKKIIKSRKFVESERS